MFDRIIDNTRRYEKSKRVQLCNRGHESVIPVVIRRNFVRFDLVDLMMKRVKYSLPSSESIEEFFRIGFQVILVREIHEFDVILGRLIRNNNTVFLGIIRYQPI